jgi:hypothetical protein
MCAAAARHFRRHLGGCAGCREGLRWRAQLAVLTGMIRRPTWRERAHEAGRRLVVAGLRALTPEPVRSWVRWEIEIDGRKVR